MTFNRYNPEQRQAERAAQREANMAALCVPSRSLHRGVIGGSVQPIPQRAKVKVPRQRMQSLLDSAKGEECLVRIPGCDGDTEKTIWSHYRGSAGGKGGARKSNDLCGAYACTYCDGVYDGQVPRPAGMSKENVDRLWLEAHIRSLVRAHEKGVL